MASRLGINAMSLSSVHWSVAEDAWSTNCFRDGCRGSPVHVERSGRHLVV